MSSAPHAHDAHAHDAHDDHAFSGEPVTALAPDEPRTPGWIPVLGIALFAAAAVYFLAGSGSDQPEKTGGKDVDGAPAHVDAQAQPAAPEGSPRRASREEIDTLRKRIDDARKKGLLKDPDK